MKSLIELLEVLFRICISSPSVVLLGSWHSLELPQIGGGEGLALWVSSSESLSNVGVVELLSVTELEVSESTTNSGTEHKSSESHVQLNVVVEWLSSLTVHKVGVSNESTDEGESKGLGTSSNIPVVVNIKETEVEHLWVVLDQLDRSDLGGESGVILLNIGWVASDI